MSLSRRSLLLSFALPVAAVAACYTGPHIGPTTTTVPNATDPAGNVIAAGLPCEIANLIQEHCASCHADPPRSGATVTIASRADLLADHDGRPLGALVVERLRDSASPMPPDGLLSDADVASFAKWVDDGMPEGSCGSVDTTPAPIDIKCTSGQFWTKGDDGDERMRPGEACITCHTQKSKTMGDDGDDDGRGDGEGDDAPLFTAAGTVYPTLHEPNDCFGLGSRTQVVLTGADGKKQTLTVNSAGNFMTKVALSRPYTASVIHAGKTRTMKTAQQIGDCNSCHTAEGGDAPGRIVAP